MLPNCDAIIIFRLASPHLVITPREVHQNPFLDLKLGCRQNPDLLLDCLPMNPRMVPTYQEIFQKVSHNLWECGLKQHLQLPSPTPQGNCLQTQKLNICPCMLIKNTKKYKNESGKECTIHRKRMITLTINKVC